MSLAVLALLTAGCGAPDPSDTRGLRLSTVLSSPTAETGARFAVADRVVPIRFPADYGAHPGFQSEWWYLTLMLQSTGDDRQRQFGAQFTAFRQALAPGAAADGGWRSNDVYLGHLALSDVAGRRHVEAERLARGHAALAGARAAPFAVWVEGWRLESLDADSVFPMRLDAAADTFAIDVTVRQTRAEVLQGDRGLSDKGEAGVSPNGQRNASYYFSVPRLAVEGTVTYRGRRHAVSGLGWMDREWSTSVLAETYDGWDWFQLQMDGGRDFMLFELRSNRPDVADFRDGTRVDAGGQARLGRDDFTLTALRHFRDRDGVRWPVAWRLELTPSRETLIIEAAFDDQVMDTMIRYWEGLVFVTNERGDRLGTGYMELTGYH